MGDGLYEWCMEKMQEHPDLKFQCSNLESSDTGAEYNVLQEILKESVINRVNNDSQNLQKEIVEKRKQVEDLKNLIQSKNYETHERRHQELQKIANRYYVNLISYIILLVVAILMAIILIYYFFIYRKK